MLKVYRTIQGVVAFLMIAVAGVMLSLENAEETARTKTSVRNWEVAGRFFLNDPNTRDILAKIDESRGSFNAMMDGMADNVSGVVGERVFVQEIFGYLMSKKMPGIETLVRSRLGTNFYFRDFVILDSAKNVVYKWGGTAFPLEFHDFPGQIRLEYLDGDIAFEVRYVDDSVDADLEVFAVYSGEWIQKALMDFNFPAFFAVNGGIYSSVGEVPDDIRTRLVKASNRVSALQGFDNYEGTPVVWQKTMLGNLGVVYPARSAVSYLLILLKLAGAALLVVILAAIDHAIVRVIRENEGVRPSRRRSGKPGEAAEEEKHLDWIEHFIEGSEEKK